MGTSCISSRTACLFLSGEKWRDCRKGLGPRVKPKQCQNGCHFISYLAYITGAKFEQHHSNAIFPEIFLIL